MKPAKLMAAALCAAACMTTTAFAEEDSLVDSAPTMPIADPVNPQPGMLFKGYNIHANAKNLPSKLTDDVPAITTTVLKTDNFSIGEGPNVSGVWEGFLKCKRSAKCTIIVAQPYMGKSCVLFVNGKRVATIEGGGNCVDYVDMKAGFNHIKLFASGKGVVVSVSLKDAESTDEPKPISPNILFYDKKPDPGDVF